MNNTKQKQQPVTRTYEIGGTKYIVKATSKEGATETAKDIIQRLIRKDIQNRISQKQ